MVGVVILAAGEGKRMKSDRAKVLVEVAGRPMIDSVIEAARAVEPAKIAVVVGDRLVPSIAAGSTSAAPPMPCDALRRPSTASTAKSSSSAAIPPS